MPHQPPPPTALTGLTPEEIAATLGLPLMRGRQMFHWLHKKRVFDLEAMTNMPKSLREKPPMESSLTALTVVERHESSISGTVKLLFQLEDGEVIESVLLRHGDRVTFCLSSQVGCALNCSFCATGLVGFRRQLSTAEIVEQALRLAQEAELADSVTPNIVYMGMGEPFQNYEAVIHSVHLLMRKDGMGVGARKITLSTVGDVPGIQRFAQEPWQVRLSVSLHAADDALRDQLAPINRRYPLAALRDALKAYQRHSGRQITIEWTLLRKINDGPDQANALAEFLKGLDAVVNLIPWNPVESLPYKASSPARAAAFARALESVGVKATIRKERGDDIEAACGQLRATRLAPTP